MDWPAQFLDHEILRISQTPVTPFTLLLLTGAALLAGIYGQQVGAALARLLSRLPWPGRSRPATTGSAPNAFGTFAGVFTPSILTILGVVMYLRLGWVVGNAGLGGTLIVVGVSHLITLATGLSISSVATNRTVGAGGAYYIISRSLGAPTGAAIGIPLFFGQALSVTFYIIGFTESLAMLIPGLPQVHVSSVICVVLTLISLKSARLAIKTQYFVMAAIGLSLLSFFGGRVAAPPVEIAWWNPDGRSLTEVFAVFFPAVTGIMAGVGMSGDLKDPRKSLPRGTMMAIGVGLLVYIAFPAWLAVNASSATLVNAPRVVWDIAYFPALIYVGVWGATLSSALGSILTAPRTLQALAYDGLAPRFLARGGGATNEPRVATVLTFLLAQTGIMLGNLDAIAPVLTMFFLVTYGFINLACGLERWAASPSFRPDFTVPAAISLLGALACLYVMSIINMLAMFGATAVCFTIYAMAQRRALGTTYGDARHGIWAAIVRSALYKLRGAEFHALNWRPNVIVMGGDHEKRPHLLQLGSILVQDRGIITYFQLIKGRPEDLAGQRRSMQRLLDDELEQRFPHVFCRVDVVDDVYRGVVQVAQSYGVGSFEANTVMLGWQRRQDRRAEYLDMLRDLVQFDRSLLIVNYNSELKFGARRSIHIWWGGLQGNGGLMLLLAFLITAYHQWRDAEVTLLTVVSTEQERARAEAGIERVLANARVAARPRVILREGREIHDIMHAESGGADLAIIGLGLPPRDAAPEPFFERMDRMLEGMPTTVLVYSARNFRGEPVLFDQE